MKKLFLLFTILISMKSFSQKDSIVNYLDKKGEITKNKTKARFIETIVKKDSVWLVTQFYRNGKVSRRGFYNDRKKKKPIGQFFSFFRDGKLKSEWNYNTDSKLEGVNKYWFGNGNLDRIGYNQNDKRIGIWKYYHVNGKDALRQYFTEGKLVKNVFYDSNGEKLNQEKELIEFQKPKFRGGDFDGFYKEIKELHNKMSFQKDSNINGYVYINFIVGEDGNVRDVNVNSKIPAELENFIIKYFQEVKGWEPAIHMNRKVPFNINVPINFYTTFN